ncbi:hypothetical protein BSKO_09109 [Bryopsis sp. KO-2023]|nr:hypothetical protein BSKO_09109 [Bryopsis sp. KO-2023]
MWYLTEVMLEQPKPRVLVLYIFSNTDPEYINNLRFFVREGMRPDDGCDYYIVIQTDNQDEAPNIEFPALPENARYIIHKNECYDWGTFGWVLKKKVHTSKYYRFIFMNSSIRGPYFPSFLKGNMHWTEPFLSKLNDEVKLVGPTISCEGAPLHKGDDSVSRRNPHVQSYLVATDRVGLEIIMASRKTLGCYDEIQEVIYWSELGVSHAILEAGFNIDSLMLRYQGVDWRRKENWNCNDRMNPYLAKNYDGVFVNPLEVLFVKVKDQHAEGHVGTSTLARKYQQWMEDEKSVSRSISANAAGASLSTRVLEICSMQFQAKGCLDIDYYKEKNPDVPKEWSSQETYNHFIAFGQFESRKFRLNCDDKIQTYTKKLAAESRASVQQTHRFD